ncbi:hypothetical protein CBS101457_002284 [Exobasidium rhododendri]|nr:hypothetical protein CBS101457_002284 [Exobasidium rhododendri]
MSSSSTSDKENIDEDSVGGEEDVEEDEEEGIESGRPVKSFSSQGAYSGHNTGVKGVRNDARRHEEAQRTLRNDVIRSTNARMERKALGKSRTWQEDVADQKREAEMGMKPGQELRLNSTERQQQQDDDEDDGDLYEIRQRRLDSLRSQAASNEARRKRLAGEGEADQRSGFGASFGHLREVGPDQYAHAIDGEHPSVFVVVHIYVKYVHACAQLTSALSSLARMHTNVKFIQVRAGSIGFGSGEKDDLDAAEADEEASEVVPTLLVYKAGRLLANLVRVDLEEQWGEGAERDVRNILSQ